MRRGDTERARPSAKKSRYGPLARRSPTQIALIAREEPELSSFLYKFLHTGGISHRAIYQTLHRRDGQTLLGLTTTFLANYTVHLRQLAEREPRNQIGVGASHAASWDTECDG